MEFQYKTQGVCSRGISLTLTDDNIISDLEINGGCDGNLQGIIALVKGQRAEDIVARLQGIRCGRRQTSCPDQLAIALTQALEANKNNRE